jgi:hypothetical protein
MVDACVEAAQELQRKLEAARAQLSPNQVKKQRKKVSKLYRKVRDATRTVRDPGRCGAIAAPSQRALRRHERRPSPRSQATGADAGPERREAAQGDGGAVAGPPHRGIELKQRLQRQRDKLTRNQLKKQRKKLSKLFNKVWAAAAVLAIRARSPLPPVPCRRSRRRSAAALPPGSPRLLPLRRARRARRAPPASRAPGSPRTMRSAPASAPASRRRSSSGPPR